MVHHDSQSAILITPQLSDVGREAVGTMTMLDAPVICTVEPSD
jgi:hypothetical protein